MRNISYAALAVLIAVFLVSGCARMQKMQVRSYIQEQERVDQEMTGNAGYLMGKPENVKGPSQSTRDVLVVEVIEDVEPVPYDIDVEGERRPRSGSGTAPRPGDFENPYEAPDVSVPDVRQTEAEPGPVRYEEYKILKDDTLQKISKKFYGSYAKWTRIYNANKDKIKDPDNIQPGMVIRVPVE